MLPIRLGGRFGTCFARRARAHASRMEPHDRKSHVQHPGSCRVDGVVPADRHAAL